MGTLEAVAADLGTGGSVNMVVVCVDEAFYGIRQLTERHAGFMVEQESGKDIRSSIMH